MDKKWSEVGQKLDKTSGSPQSYEVDLWGEKGGQKMDMCKVLDIPFPRLFCEESTPPTRGGEIFNEDFQFSYPLAGERAGVNVGADLQVGGYSICVNLCSGGEPYWSSNLWIISFLCDLFSAGKKEQLNNYLFHYQIVFSEPLEAQRSSVNGPVGAVNHKLGQSLSGGRCNHGAVS